MLSLRYSCFVFTRDPEIYFFHYKWDALLVYTWRVYSTLQALQLWTITALLSQGSENNSLLGSASSDASYAILMPLHQASVSWCAAHHVCPLILSPEVGDIPLHITAHEAEAEEADQLEMRNLLIFTQLCVILHVCGPGFKNCFQQDMVAHACHSSTWEVEAEGIWGQPGLTKSQANLGSIARPYLKKTKTKPVPEEYNDP